jgi:flagellar biosynthetic protein FliR
VVISSFLLLFARSLGFFFLSPLFERWGLPPFVRLGFSIVTTLLFAPAFLSHQEQMLPFFVVNLLKEGVIGYVLGFLFSLLFESAALAGNVIGTMMGLNVAGLFGGDSSPVLSKAFMLLIGALIFSLDLHHLILRIFYQSYSIVPQGLFTFQGVDAILSATALLFKHMIHYALYPLFCLSALLITLAIASRIFPELPILWMGFPLQLLVGFGAILASLPRFSEILERSFFELCHFIDRNFFSLIQ